LLLSVLCSAFVVDTATVVDSVEQLLRRLGAERVLFDGIGLFRVFFVCNRKARENDIGSVERLVDDYLTW